MSGIYKHKKTGNIYYLLLDDIIDATNAQDGQRMCLYVNQSNQLFVREYDEFFIKFEELKQ